MGLERMHSGGKDPRITIQPYLAREIFGDAISPKEAGERWVKEGYAEKFRDFLQQHDIVDFDSNDPDQVIELIDKLRGTTH